MSLVIGFCNPICVVQFEEELDWFDLYGQWMFYNPFEQFQVQLHKIVTKDYSEPFTFFTHSYFITDTILMSTFICVLLYVYLIAMSFRKRKFTRNKVTSTFKWVYSFVEGTMAAYLPEKGQIYFPFFFYLLVFIVISNLIGIFPYAFTLTSHLSLTFSLSYMVWFGGTIIGFEESGLRYFMLVLPRGIPFVLVPFLVFVETVSYTFRSVSLALRLFANIVAGHILLDTLALFIYKMIYPTLITIKTFIISIIPFILCLVLVMFECIVAMLQGYIFVVLSCIYLKDSYSATSH